MKALGILTLSLAILGTGVTTVSSAPGTQDSPKEGYKSKDSATNTIKTAPQKEIFFFINPNGRPCQMQLSILDGMKDKLAPLATIKYIKTTEPADQELFYKYGIRGLPFLLIMDKNGKELKRFTPGIQDEATILSALGAGK